MNSNFFAQAKFTTKYFSTIETVKNFLKQQSTYIKCEKIYISTVRPNLDPILILKLQSTDNLCSQFNHLQLQTSDFTNIVRIYKKVLWLLIGIIYSIIKYLDSYNSSWENITVENL